MKKNLVKLALSGAALAAVAATLGTSTYAWYTTNPTVNASNIIGASSDTGASSIFISKDTGDDKNWSQSVKFADNAFTTTLTPAQPTATVGSFTDLGGTANGSIITVRLFFKTSKTAADVNLYVKTITITNSTTTMPAADNLLAGDDATVTEAAYGVDKGWATYYVDFTRALGMQIDAAGEAEDQTFGLDAYNDSFKTGDRYITLAANAKAHAYYNKVMPADKAISGDAITAGKNKTTTLDRTKPIAVLDKNCAVSEVKFHIFLNGWNDYCYDACQGQKFTLNMSFTSEAPTGA